MATIDERVSRLEGGFDHLATRADVANLKVWIMGLLLTVVASALHSAANLIVRLPACRIDATLVKNIINLTVQTQLTTKVGVGVS